MASLRDTFAQPGSFDVAAELVTSRGPITSERAARMLVAVTARSAATKTVAPRPEP